MFDLDCKGLDWQGQIKLGNGAFYGVNYLQVREPKYEASAKHHSAHNAHPIKPWSRLPYECRMLSYG
jgi:hypothetical protein